MMPEPPKLMYLLPDHYRTTGRSIIGWVPHLKDWYFMSYRSGLGWYIEGLGVVHPTHYVLDGWAVEKDNLCNYPATYPTWMKRNA